MKNAYLIFLFFISATCLSAADLETVVSKYYDAVGGKEKINNVKSWYFKGISTIKTMNMTGEMEYWYKKPDKIKVMTQFQKNKVIQSYNGDFAWQINTMMGINSPQKLDTSSHAQLLAQKTIVLGPLFNYGRKGFDFTYTGEIEKNGEKLHHITMTSDLRKSRIDIFIDTKSFLPVLTITIANFNNNQVEVINYIKDYKNVDGFMLPHKYESVVSGQPYTTLEIDKIETNIELKDNIFSMPENANSK